MTTTGIDMLWVDLWATTRHINTVNEMSACNSFQVQLYVRKGSFTPHALLPATPYLDLFTLNCIAALHTSRVNIWTQKWGKRSPKPKIFFSRSQVQGSDGGTLPLGGKLQKVSLPQNFEPTSRLTWLLLFSEIEEDLTHYHLSRSHVDCKKFRHVKKLNKH